MSILVAIMVIAGALFMLLAALGLLRLPDLYLRMSATCKAATLGASLVLIGVALHFGTIAVTGRAAVVIVFLFLTAPLAAHAIGRAGYRRGSPLWEGTIADEMAEGPAPESESEPAHPGGGRNAPEPQAGVETGRHPTGC